MLYVVYEHVSPLPQYTLATDAFQLGYTEDGHCKGEVDRSLYYPQRLVWDIPAEVRAAGNVCVFVKIFCIIPAQH